MDELGDIQVWKQAGFQIEEIKKQEEAHDLKIDLSNAIRSIWLLYRRGRWKELEELGLCRERAEPSFELFDMLKFRGSKELVKTETETLLFIKMCPGVVVAANNLLKRYKERQDNEDI